MMRRRGLVAWFLASLLSGGAAEGVRGQEVRLAEAPRTEGQRALAAFLERGDWELWTRDTVLARADTVRSDVLLLEGAARISGRIEGDIYVVDGDLFLRTRASIGGDVVVLGGGFYDSDLAEVEGAITYRPNERLRVRPAAGGFEILAEIEPRPAVELDGTYGVRLPVYQRVDAVTAGWGGLARALRLPGRPEIEVVTRYRTGPADLEASGRLSVYPSDRLRLGMTGGRETRTRDGWIRPAWYNSLATAVAEDDAFDYYQADHAAFEIEWRAAEPPIWEEAPAWRWTLRAGWEDAHSLDARDIWAVFEDDDPAPGSGSPPGSPHPNPAVDDGNLFFAALAYDREVRSRGGRTAFGAAIEAAHDDDLAGDLSFLMAEVRLSARHATSWGHAWDVFAIARGDLAGSPPRQRYSTVGGVGTLPTIPLRAFRGARLVYGEAGYAVPLLGVATLGGVDAFVRGSAGSAWSEGDDVDLAAAVAGGVAVRVWDFQLETGVAAGSAMPGGGTDVTVFFDVRVRRTARPTDAARPGRGF